jgi:GNAT superfamily N-acetyltransferase
VEFREDWLAPVMQVPYVPTLGAVHPRAASAATFNTVMSAAGTGKFLDCDKDARWFETKDEEILAGEVIHEPGLTVVPALSTRGGQRTLNVYWYGQEPPAIGQVVGQAAAWRAACGADAARVTWFQDHPHGARTRLMFRTYSPADQRPSDHRVTELRESAAASTWPAFVEEMTYEGLGFLDDRLAAGTVTAPVLVSVEDGRIVGVAGPQNVMTDPIGQPFAPPQYFVVHPDCRRQGHGRALWHAAMAWGQARGAAFKVIECSAGRPAEQFYLSQGLTGLGYVCRQEIP